VPDLSSEPLTPAYLSSQDCIFIATNHSGYDFGFVVEPIDLVIPEAEVPEERPLAAVGCGAWLALS
jgi:hypothetical protein